MHGSVLVATDLSTSADGALRQGKALAHDLGARLVICHVLPDFSEVRVDIMFVQFVSRMVTANYKHWLNISV
jgi:nucleotide-binding universal stress UspA family protein